MKTKNHKHNKQDQIFQENLNFLLSKVLLENQIQMKNLKISFHSHQTTKLLQHHKNYNKICKNFFKKVYNTKNFLLHQMKK